MINIICTISICFKLLTANSCFLSNGVDCVVFSFYYVGSMMIYDTITMLKN